MIGCPTGTCECNSCSNPSWMPRHSKWTVLALNKCRLGMGVRFYMGGTCQTKNNTKWYCIPKRNGLFFPNGMAFPNGTQKENVIPMPVHPIPFGTMCQLGPMFHLGPMCHLGPMFHLEAKPSPLSVHLRTMSHVGPRSHMAWLCEDGLEMLFTCCYTTDCHMCHMLKVLHWHTC